MVEIFNHRCPETERQNLPEQVLIGKICLKFNDTVQSRVLARDDGVFEDIELFHTREQFTSALFVGHDVPRITIFILLSYELRFVNLAAKVLLFSEIYKSMCVFRETNEALPLSWNQNIAI